MLSMQPFKDIGTKEFQLFSSLLIDQSLTSFDELVIALASNGFDIEDMTQVKNLRASFVCNFQTVIEALHLAFYNGICNEKLRNIRMLTEAIKFKLPDGGTLIAGTSVEMAMLVSRLAVNFASATSYSSSYGDVHLVKDLDYAYTYLLYTATKA